MNKSIALLVIVFIMLPSVVLAQFQIGTQSVTITDPNRSNRSIGLEIYYPANTSGTSVALAAQAGGFPIIVIGHGFTMGVDAYQNFWEDLVPQGYIVALPSTETGFSPSHNNFGLDLAFTVDWFIAQGSNSGSFYYNSISGKAAVMGHSMGGGCSYIAANNSSNIDVIATFAAAETNPSAISAAASVTIPALVFSGSKDKVAPPADHQIPIYNALASTCKDYITITDGAHCRFAESNTLCQTGEGFVCIACSFLSRATHHAIQFRILKPWLKFYLQGDCTQLSAYRNEVNNPSGYTIVQNCNFNLPVAAIQVNGSNALCPGESTQLVGSGDGTYVWSNSATDTTITVAQANTYSLVVTGYNACTDTASQTITANTVVKPILSSNNGLLLCPGDVTELSLNTAYVSYSWSNGGTQTKNIVSAGTYWVTVVDGNGCSAVSDTLTIVTTTLYLQPQLFEQNDTIFVTEGLVQNWLFNGTANVNFTGQFIASPVTGTYAAVVADTNGCLHTTNNISIVIPNTIVIDTTVCFGQSVAGYNQSGIYKDTFTVVNPDDSIRTLILTVLPLGISALSATICAGDTYLGYNANGIYVDTFTNTAGCDSIRTLTLTVEGVFTANVSISICDGDSLFVGQNYQAMAGLYYDTILSVRGCDSVIIETMLSLNALPGAPTITQNGLLLSADSGFASYQWYKDTTAIGSSNNELQVTDNGNYYVLVTDSNGCTSSLSSAFVVTGVGIEAIQSLAIAVYPNPTDGVLTIDLGERLSGKITVTNMLGQQVKQLSFSQTKLINLNVVVESGLYFITIETNKAKAVTKLLVN